MTDAPSWSLTGTHAMACNCAYGCPCAFDAPPTYGTCEAILAVRVDEGEYRGVDLAGVTYVAVASWPGPLHEGNGRGVVFFDESLAGERRDALEAIALGRAGGGWGIFMSTMTAGVEQRDATITYEPAGQNTRVIVDDVVELVYEPIRNPVTGDEHHASLSLPTGLLTRQQDHYASKVHRVDIDGFRWEYPGRTAAEMPITWTGP